MNFYLKFSRVLYACRANARTLGSVTSWPREHIDALRELVESMSSNPPRCWLDSYMGSELEEIQGLVGAEMSATLGLDALIERVNATYTSLGILPIEYPIHMQ